MNRRMRLLSLFAMFSTLLFSCGKGEEKIQLSKQDQPKPAAISIPDKFVGSWLEYHLEKSILFDVCQPRTVMLEQGGTEFFYVTLGDVKKGTTKYRIHRLREQDGSLFMYATPKGSLAGTDTTLVIMEPVNTTAGVMRIREFGRAADYPKEDGTIYFVGDEEIVSPNPCLDPCDS